jgi:cytochrome c
MVQSIIVQGFASKMKSSLLLGVVLFVSLFSGASLQAGDIAAGEKVFRKCSACHVVAKEQHRTGPHLVGLFGRAAATADGYKKYSKALKASGIIWDKTSLNDYLEAPKKYVKGTRMAFAGLKKQADRDNVITYLQQFSQ